MPKRKTKKFIDKKNSVTFHLVHRSQKDPLAADETAPQRVLVPIETTKIPKQNNESVHNVKKHKEEEQKFGIFFDDDYDYLQHLRDVTTLSTEWERVENPNHEKENKEKPAINLPSSVFASNVEEEVGLLNRAAPVSGLRLDLDPDVVAALDDDFNFNDPENELEDNFMEMAMTGNSDNDEDEGKEYYIEDYDEEEAETDSDVSSTGRMAVSDEERDEVGSLNGSKMQAFKDEETRSRFSSYSMSSSVIKRNEQLSLLDDKFEKMYADYDDTEIGALDCEEIEGFVNPDSDIVLQCAEEYEKQQKEDSENLTKLMQDRMKIVGAEYSSSEGEEELDKLVVEIREKDKWDCESIISTYSNIYNHPKLIIEPKGPGKIKIDSRTGIPKDVLNGPTEKLTAKSLAQFDLENQRERSTGVQSIAETMKSTLSVLSVRPKDESSSERKERKKALKEYRKERRLERKANIEAFKEEKKRQEKIMLNNKQNLLGNRIL